MIILPSRQFEGSDLGLDDPVVFDGADISGTLKEHIGSIIWLSDREGFCRCPGAHLHTTRGSKKDCKIYLRPVPTLSCFHSSCRVPVEETSKRLRQALAGVIKQERPDRLSAEEKAKLAEIQQKEALRRRAATSRHQILRDTAWPIDSIISRSQIPDDASVHWRHLLRLFSLEDVVWIGSLYDSGKPANAASFKKVDDWLKGIEAPGQFTCPSTFNPGSYSRGNANVLQRRYLVVESDELDRNSILAVFRWVREGVGVPLRAIVDTAGRSLHGWFEYPTSDEVDDLRIVLPELGCDPKMFTASQPCRLPGALRDDRVQKLIYLDTEGLQ